MTQSSAKPYCYVALGDSLANGVGANGNGYPQQLQHFLQQLHPTEVHLFATNGQTSTQLLRKQNLYRNHFKQANLITVNIGGNDLRLTWRLYSHRVTPKSIQKKRLQLTLTTLANNWNELAKIISTNSSNNAKVLFINLYNPYQQKHPQTRAFVNEANCLLETVCANYGFEVIDARGLLNAASKKLPTDQKPLLAKDNLHLTQHGHAIIANAVYDVVRPSNMWDKIKIILKIKPTPSAGM